MELILPWPSKDLSPNARVHWRKRAKAAADARALAKPAAWATGWLPGIDLPEGRLHLWIDFYPPTRRLPDDDNMLARVKPYRDGIADGVFRPNDLMDHILWSQPAAKLLTGAPHKLVHHLLVV